jgi:hypothetical protein
MSPCFVVTKNINKHFETELVKNSGRAKRIRGRCSVDGQSQRKFIGYMPARGYFRKRVVGATKTKETMLDREDFGNAFVDVYGSSGMKLEPVAILGTTSCAAFGFSQKRKGRTEVRPLE